MTLRCMAAVMGIVVCPCCSEHDAYDFSRRLRGMKTASAETASLAGGVACRGFRLFRPQLTGGIKDLPILGLRHGLAVGDEHLQMLDGFGDVDVQARSGSGGGTGAAFDEREDVLFLICVRKAVCAMSSRCSAMISIVPGTPAKCFRISSSRAAGTGRA